MPMLDTLGDLVLDVHKKAIRAQAVCVYSHVLVVIVFGLDDVVHYAVYSLLYLNYGVYRVCSFVLLLAKLQHVVHLPVHAVANNN
jgi:hypothetical protein